MASPRCVVRLADEDDVHAIIDCALTFPSYDVVPEAIEPLIRASIAQGACFVAVEAQVTGFLVGLVLPHPFSGRAYVDWIALYVQLAHRRTGAGLGLLRKMLRFSWREPLELVKIAVADSRLRTFLHRQGFREVETVLIKGDAWQQFRS